MLIFSSDIERDAAFPDGIPDGVTAGVAGVGLIDAAIGTARLVAMHAPEQVLYIGTCGAYKGAGVAMGDLVVGTEAILCSGDVAHGWMRLPQLLSAELPASQSISFGLLDTAAEAGIATRTVRVGCTLGITEHDELASALSSAGSPDVENMEAFAIARAAGNIPVGILLGVTNIVGPGGGRDWAANYREMMRRAAELALRWHTRGR